MAQCKVSSFEATTESTDVHPLVGEYSMALAHDGGSLNAKVQINRARYPSEPPVWTLGTATGTASGTASSDPPLFDASLAEIERHVNVRLIDELSSAPSTVDSAFEWVLAIQLRLILASLEAEGAGTGGGSRGKKRKTTSD